MKSINWLCITLISAFLSLSVMAEETSVPTVELKSSTKKPHDQKSPRSLLSVDPYDVDGTGVDVYDAEGTIAVDPYDVYEGEDSYNQATPPAYNEDSEKGTEFKIPKPDFVYEWEESWNDWRQRTREKQPPLKVGEIGSEVGAGYVGAFGGSVLGLFGGFLVGSLYGELAGCSRCWIDVATTTSTVGATLLTSAGVYMFGNNEKQLGSIYATYAGSMIPVVLALGLFDEKTQVQKSGFYLLTMPLFATLGYNLSRYYRRPDEKPVFENIFIDDTWVSYDPGTETLAFNLTARF